MPIHANLILDWLLDWPCTHQGQHLLCDLQGGGYDTHYVLTDPAVLSMKQEFGATDGGKNMMQNLGHFNDKRGLKLSTEHSHQWYVIYPDHPMYDIYANIWLRRLEKQHWPIYGIRSQFLTTFKNLWNLWNSDNIREHCPINPTNLIPSCSHPDGSLALNSTMIVPH